MHDRARLQAVSGEVTCTSIIRANERDAESMLYGEGEGKRGLRKMGGNTVTGGRHSNGDG